MAGNFRGVEFLRMVDLYNFAGLIFTDARTHAHYVLYNQAYIYFAGLIFVLRRSSAKTVKIGPLKNFPPYSSTHCLRYTRGDLGTCSPRKISISETISSGF